MEEKHKSTNQEEDAFSPPTIFRPKDGSVTKGKDEKFVASQVTGTVSITISQCLQFRVIRFWYHMFRFFTIQVQGRSCLNLIGCFGLINELK